MNIGISYASQDKQIWLEIQIPEESTVKDAIQASGILTLFEDINLDKQKVGIFGKIVKLDAMIKDGDRVEIYRPIIADPKTVKRRDKNDDDDDDDDD